MNPFILIIDDDSSVRDAFELALEDEPYRVISVETGENGILAAAKNRPDLIFLDLKMPGLNGVETMTKLLAQDSSLQIYIVTAFAKEYMEELSEARAKGLTFDIAAKPLGFEQIREIASVKLA